MPEPRGEPAADDDDGRAQERWARVAEALDAALDAPAAERDRLLRERCGDDADLRAEVEALLRAATRDGFLDAPAARFAAPLLDDARDDDAPAEEGGRVGPFRVVREIGRGGMGAVYLAEREGEEFRQRVAIKLVRGGADTPGAVRRFVEERRILASLEHPDIARLVDGGVTAAGVPWFAMEYVEGAPLDAHCDADRLPVEARIELFCRVCDAVQYAHRNLVVHRDLKPSNVLVAADGRPKLLDFGIAKLLPSAADAAAAGATGLGGRPLTPEYASPEQLRGEPVSTASDVYALGVVLYLLLTGRHPFAAADGATADPLRPLLDEPPPLPSACVAADPEATSAAAPPAERAAARGTTPAALARRLRGDLDAIVLKAMRREPDARYPTADGLAADLRRHLGGLPVGARADTRRYRLRKFVGRNRAAVTSTAGAAALLLGFSVVTALQAERLAAERDRARQAEEFLVGMLHRADPYQGRGRAMTVRELLDAGRARLESGASQPPEVRARLHFALGRAYHGLGEYDQAVALLDSSRVALRRLHGDAHPETISVANQLADVLRFAGRYDEARALYASIIDARRRRHGNVSTEVARSLNGLAMVLRMQGRPEEAEPLLREALAIDRRHVAAEPAALTQTLNNLGHVLREQGDLAGAEALHRESLAARRALWGEAHFEVSVSLSNLAGVVRDRGDLVAADSLYRHALELRLRLVGDAHPDVAGDRAGYARLLHLRGEPAAAEPLYRRALAVQRRALPEGHPVTATTLLELGRVLLDLDRPAEAEPLLREALAARARALAPGHRLVVEAQDALDACAAELARAARA
jgi:eukaryotic-like serine/threonine-protein kinase